MKLNCWEIKKCGREPGGRHAGELGVCPVPKDVSSDGINGGKNAGRICWDIPHTLCEGKVHDDFSHKAVACVSCEVFNHIKNEEGVENFNLLRIFRDWCYSDRVDKAHRRSDFLNDTPLKLPVTPHELIITDSTGEKITYRRVRS